MNPDIYTIAKRLSPHQVESVTELQKGGNSRIYKVLTNKGVYALKRYPLPSAKDPRDRLHTETLALQYMRKHGIKNIPEVIAKDPEQAYSLLNWIDGDAVTQINDNDIISFAQFLSKLAEMSGTATEENMPYASEACVSGSMILQHIEQRMEKLEKAACEHTELEEFLSRILKPYIQGATDRARNFYSKHNLSFNKDIDRKFQVLIPSDFGGHNALRSAGGLYFLDFEYFGWDDPVTSTANFLLHPAMSLSEHQKQQFLTLMEKLFIKSDPLYAERLTALLPLYAARMCNIILGEFIPERFAHRVQSGQYKVEDKQSILSGQLAKAKKLIKLSLI